MLTFYYIGVSLCRNIYGVESYGTREKALKSEFPCMTGVNHGAVGPHQSDENTVRSFFCLSIKDLSVSFYCLFFFVFFLCGKRHGNRHE